MERMEIIDDSGDKNYFTIIPNYIANHSTANDQALYFQMKRFAGENGHCFASEKRLCDQMKIGRKALKKSLNYLLDNGWIKFVGMKETETRGGKQPIKVYSIVNIWDKNNLYYKGVSEREPLEDKGVSERTQGGAPKSPKGVLQRTIEEEPVLRRTIEEDTAEQSSAGLINPFIEKFKQVNPSYKRLFANKTQRSALQRLIDEIGTDKLGRIIDYLPKTNAKPYAPTITTPLQLEEKMGQLMAFVQKERNDKKGIQSL